MPEWFMRRAGAVSGPFSWEELQFLAERGRLAPDDAVRPSDQPAWQPARSLRPLFPAEPPSRPVPGRSVSSQHTGGLPSPSDAGRVPAANSKPRPPRDKLRQAAPGMPSARDGDDVAIAAEQGLSARQRWLIGIGALAGIVLVIVLLLLLDFATSGRPGGATQANTAGAAAAGSTGGIGSGGSFGGGSDAGAAAGALARTEQPGAPTAGREGLGRRESDAATRAPDVERPRQPDPPAPGSFTLQRLDAAAGPPGGAAGAGRGTGDGTGAGSEFFGVKADGTRFVYIVDCSGSMAGRPFQKACAELKDSIRKLRNDQAFYVYFFSSLTFPMFDSNRPEPDLLPATPDNRARLEAWVAGTSARGGTEPRDALLQALKLKPEAIFLLTDGSFDAGVVEAVHEANRDGVVINTIGFMNPVGEDVLKQIAEQNRGTYRFVP